MISAPPDASSKTSIALLVVMLASSSALAQTTPAGGKAGTDPQQLDAVTVTGRVQPQTVQVGSFRDADPLDVPLTNNVITREVLDAQGARTLYEALRNTAGVTRTQLNGATYDNIAIRGILVENRGNYRLNGSLPIINLIDVPLENKQQVEVLKGASSLYYGLVPPSGIINYTTKRAGAAPVTNVSLSANEFGALGAHVDVGRRFGADGDYGLRINAAAGREDIGVDRFAGDRRLLSAAFDLNIGPARVKLDAESYAKDVSEPAAIVVPAAVAGRIALPAVPDNRSNLASEWQRYDARANNLLARVDVDLSDRYALAVELGRARTERDRRFSQFQNYDLASGNGTLRIFFQDGQWYENTNARAELLARLQTGSFKHELTVGATRNEREQDIGNAPTIDVAQNLYAPRAIDPLSRPAPALSNPSRIVDNGVYLFDRIAIGSRWQMLLGARHTDYDSRTQTSRFTARELNPSASVMYRPAQSLSLYASYLEGLEESGQAPQNRANAGEVLPPAVTRQRELGAKAEVAAGVLLQAAVFEIERPSTTVDAANRFVIGGASLYRGLELSAAGEITARWSVVASALLMNAEIRRATNALEVGKVPDNTPERTFSLFTEYQLAAVPGLAVSAAAFHTGKRPVNNVNQAFIDDVTTYSLGARYRTRLQSYPLTLQANVDNLTDERYWSNAGNGLLGVGAPRTLKLAATVSF
jgi:iron complex outermembrane receptor protein